jgi:hypothetical protein
VLTAGAEVAAVPVVGLEAAVVACAGTAVGVLLPHAPNTKAKIKVRAAKKPVLAPFEFLNIFVLLVILGNFGQNETKALLGVLYHYL